MSWPPLSVVPRVEALNPVPVRKSSPAPTHSAVPLAPFIVLASAAIISCCGDPTASLLFKNPGTATRANQTLADQEIRFDVAPRNLNFGR